MSVSVSLRADRPEVSILGAAPAKKDRVPRSAGGASPSPGLADAGAGRRRPSPRVRRAGGEGRSQPGRSWRSRAPCGPQHRP